MSHLDYYLTITPETPWHEVLKELGGHVDGSKAPNPPLYCGVCGAQNIPGGLNIPDWPWFTVEHQPIHRGCQGA